MYPYDCVFLEQVFDEFILHEMVVKIKIHSLV